MNQKGFVNIIVMVVVALVIVAGISFYFYRSRDQNFIEQSKGTVDILDSSSRQRDALNGNTQPGTGTGTIQPDDPKKTGLAMLPDLPLDLIPSQPVSAKFVVDHRTALDGKSIIVRGVVVSTLLGEEACPSRGGGTSPSPMACAQPRIFLADSLEEERNQNYDIMVLVSETEKSYTVGQTVEVEATVASSKSDVLLQKLY